MNLNNVSGESLRRYNCDCSLNNQCADPMDTSGVRIEPCAGCGLNQSASTAAAVSNVIGIPDIPNKSFLNSVCIKVVYSGKKFENIVIRETIIRI
jgi:hypothetical protein